MNLFETEALDTSSLEPVAGILPTPVPVRTLDQIATRGPSPTIVKIDVEGHEPAVFRGMADTLGQNTPPAIVFEALSVHALHRTLETLLPLIRCPWHVFRIERAGGLLHLDHMAGTNNYLALPEHQLERIRDMNPGTPKILLPIPEPSRKGSPQPLV
jgi:hypothetical protein